MTEKNLNEYAPTVYIQDLSDLTVSHLSRHNFHMMNLFTDCDSLTYPETVRKVYIINAPSAWALGWKMSKNFLDPTTIEKVAVLDAESTAQHLKQVIHPSCLPRDYGGELDYKIMGGGSHKEVKTILPKLMQVDITTELSVTVHVEKATDLSWQFRLKNDINFGIYYQSSKDAKKEIERELRREDPDNLLMQGMIRAEKPGYYTVTWDNSSNWIKRTLKYLIFFDGAVVNEKDFVGIIKK